MSELKAEDDRLYSEKSVHSSRISESCRYIGFGLLAFYYGLVTDKDTPEHDSIILIGVFGLFTLIADYLQYLGGYYSVQHALKHPKRNYVKSSVAYRVWEGMFWVKQETAIAGAIALGVWVLH